MKRRVEVVSFNPNWHNMYLMEANKLREVFKTTLLNLYHIGSTSVLNLSAKPIIDILGVFKDIQEVDAFNSKMEALGYDCMGELGIEGRRYFRKRITENDEIVDLVHVHMFDLNHERDIERHLALRDYLREHEEVAKEYGALKLQLAKQFPYDIEAYCDGKDAFVKELEQKALVWYNE